jgi:hypothetical protein
VTVRSVRCRPLRSMHNVEPSLLRMRSLIALLTAAGVAACAAAFPLQEQRPVPSECRQPYWCISGVIVDDSTSDSLEAAQVWFPQATAQYPVCAALTDETGRFKLRCSGQAGDSLVVRRPGYRAVRRRVSIRPGRAYVAQIRLKRVIVGPISDRWPLPVGGRAQQIKNERSQYLPSRRSVTPLTL